MQIRFATNQDFEELVSFYTRMNEIINTRTNNYNPENEVFPSKKMILDAMAGDGQLVGIEDGVIAAAAIVNHECNDAYMHANWQTQASPDEFWVLHALRVAPEYEGRGFAKQMLSHIINIAPARGQKAIRLDVLAGYSVEQMYNKMGFQYIDTVEIFYEDIGEPKRFKLLEKVL